MLGPGFWDGIVVSVHDKLGTLRRTYGLAKNGAIIAGYSTEKVIELILVMLGLFGAAPFAIRAHKILHGVAAKEVYPTTRKDEEIERSQAERWLVLLRLVECEAPISSQSARCWVIAPVQRDGGQSILSKTSPPFIVIGLRKDSRIEFLPSAGVPEEPQPHRAFSVMSSDDCSGSQGPQRFERCEHVARTRLTKL